MNYKFQVKESENKMRLNIFLRHSGVSAALIKKLKFLPDGILVNGEKKNTDYMNRYTYTYPFKKHRLYTVCW